ncbi:MAG: hypothetical protein WC865_17390 [Bacteroidales bacterium]
MNTKISKGLAALMLLFLISISMTIQGQIRISGFVRDKNTGERLIGANTFQAKILSVSP